MAGRPRERDPIQTLDLIAESFSQGKNPLEVSILTGFKSIPSMRSYMMRQGKYFRDYRKPIKIVEPTLTTMKRAEIKIRLELSELQTTGFIQSAVKQGKLKRLSHGVFDRSMALDFIDDILQRRKLMQKEQNK